MNLPWTAIDEAISSTSTLRVSGRVQGISGLLVEGTLPGARMGMTCNLMVGTGEAGVPAEVVALSDDRVSLMPLSAVSGITVGTQIEPVSHDASVAVGDALIGRVLDGWGRPIDGGPALETDERVPLYPLPLNPMERSTITDELPLGIQAVDGMLTSGQGQRVSILAGPGVGKSTLLGMMARYTQADVTVMGLIGERSREAKRFVETDLGPEGLSRSVVVTATSNNAAALRIRAAHVATSIAEHFRDQGKRVLLLMDSLSRVCMAQRELGLATGEPPTTRGYPPSAFAIIPQLLERAGPGIGAGSITGYYTALLEGDDLTDPIGDAIRAVTDGHIVLSRPLAEQGHYPAIDVLGSTSRVMPDVISREHKDAAAAIRRCLADLREAEELRTFGAYRPGDVPRFDRALAVATDLRDFLVQPIEEARDFETTRATMIELAGRILAAEQEGAP